MDRTDIIELKKLLEQVNSDYWLTHTFLNWEWWLLLVLTIIPWLVIWKVMDKERTYEILTYGFLLASLTMIVDNIGSSLVWWDYPNQLDPVSLPLFPADVSIVPCAMMVVYQYFKTWRSYVVAMLGLALFAAYIGEEIFILMDFYTRISFKAYHTVIFFMVAGILGKWFVEKVRGMN